MLTDVPEDAGCFHAQFRRVNPLPYRQPYTFLDGLRGTGHNAGTPMAWGVNNNRWWGEGELKFSIDGAYNWDVNGRYTTNTTPFMEMHLVVRPDGLYESQQRFSMYRWHIRIPSASRKTSG